MNDFSTKILKAISDYKFILRKNLPLSQCNTKMRELGIKRKTMRGVDEAGLHKIGLKIICDLKKQVNLGKNEKSNNSYQGSKEFLQYLEELYSSHHIDQGNVVHFGQKSSSALLDAIQLIAMAKGEFTVGIIEQIKLYGDIVTAHGTEEQKKMFLDAISVEPDLFAACSFVDSPKP